MDDAGYMVDRQVKVTPGEDDVILPPAPVPVSVVSVRPKPSLALLRAERVVNFNRKLAASNAERLRSRGTDPKQPVKRERESKVLQFSSPKRVIKEEPESD